MTDASIQLTTAEDGDLDEVIALLQATDLPTEDVRANAESIYRAHADGEFVGVGGVEVHGSNGLLRSVAVTESKRGMGYGTAICDALERKAHKNDVRTLYLLTTTATRFFEQRGYEPTDRGAAPESIRRTTEFTDLCPETANCLRKELPTDGGSSDGVDATPP